MTLGSHQKTVGASQVHITPRHILEPLGVFDLDPCAADPRPWDCARINLTTADDGLASAWPPGVRVWLNPPFDRRQVGRWLAKMAAHGRGIALLHARTETAWFQAAWQSASAILFLSQRIVFRKPDGSPQTTKAGLVANSGAPPVLIAWGGRDVEALSQSGLPGNLCTRWRAVGTEQARAA